MYVWRTWIESTGGAEAQPRNQQTSTPTTDQQTENGIHPNYSYTKWDYEEKNHCYNTRQNKQPISTPTRNEQSENE